jgi:hypothetical protein
MNSVGKLVLESILEAKTATILQFIQELRGNLHVTFEEGTWAACLYDLLRPHVTKIVVCDPRRNALLKEGNKGDQVAGLSVHQCKHQRRHRPGRTNGWEYPP